MGLHKQKRVTYKGRRAMQHSHARTYSYTHPYTCTGIAHMHRTSAPKRNARTPRTHKHDKLCMRLLDSVCIMRLYLRFAPRTTKGTSRSPWGEEGPAAAWTPQRTPDKHQGDSSNHFPLPARHPPLGSEGIPSTSYLHGSRGLTGSKGPSLGGSQGLVEGCVFRIVVCQGS